MHVAAIWLDDGRDLSDTQIASRARHPGTRPRIRPCRPAYGHMCLQLWRSRLHASLQRAALTHPPVPAGRHLLRPPCLLPERLAALEHTCGAFAGAACNMATWRAGGERGVEGLHLHGVAAGAPGQAPAAHRAGAPQPLVCAGHPMHNAAIAAPADGLTRNSFAVVMHICDVSSSASGHTASIAAHCLAPSPRIPPGPRRLEL